LCYVAVVRKPTDRNDTTAVVNWILWEMFWSDDDGPQNAPVKDGGERRPPQPRPSTRTRNSSDT
jgi:hypothetical protein